jgi:hypothetical protein
MSMTMRGLLIAFALVALTASAEIIDRIAVSVGNQVITEDQINDEIRVTAFLNHEKPDLTPAEKRKAAERLVEQTLIRREMALTHYPIPPLSDADAKMKEIERGYPNRDAFLKALQLYGIGEDDLRQRLWWQATLLKFIDERFRPTVQLSNAEIRQYYREQVQKWREQHVSPIPTFEESRSAMEQALMEERVDQALDRWLGDARTQVDIRYRKEAFR